MTNELTTFTTPAQFGAPPFRGIQINGNPWVVTVDACRTVGVGVMADGHVDV